MTEKIPLAVPSIRGNEWKYIKECLDTEWVSSTGKYVNKFEAEIEKKTGAKNAIACVNGTSALHIALILCGVKPGDEIIVPTLTFIAPVNVIRYLNADPIFMDCDDYYNIDIEKTIEFIQKETQFRDGYTYNRITGKRISAIIPVHIFGNAVELKTLISICKDRNIRIIEDASESLGTCYHPDYLEGKHTGTIGDIGCLSFNGNKIITTGGGGMILTDNGGYAEKARYLTTQAKDDDLRYIHNNIGYNYRLTNIQAALGLAQLEKLSEYLKIKKANYEYYRDKIDIISGLFLSSVPNFASNNYWMYALRIDKTKYGMDRDSLLNLLRRNNIESRPLWYLNHLQKPYQEYYSYKIELAVQLIEQTLNIPCSVNLTSSQMEYIIEIFGRN